MVLCFRLLWNAEKLEAADACGHAFLLPLLLDPHDARDAIDRDRPAGEALEFQREPHRRALLQRRVSYEIDAVRADVAHHALALLEPQAQRGVEPLVSASRHGAVRA